LFQAHARLARLSQTRPERSGEIVIACRLFRRLDGHHYPPHAAVPPTLLAIADELIE
jgi:hypothetical protein